MPLLGQASGGFTESSSALRLLHVGVRNTVGILTDDAFTQTNPPHRRPVPTTVKLWLSTSYLAEPASQPMQPVVITQVSAWLRKNATQCVRCRSKSINLCNL